MEEEGGDSKRDKEERDEINYDRREGNGNVEGRGETGGRGRWRRRWGKQE